VEASVLGAKSVHVVKTMKIACPVYAKTMFVLMFHVEITSKMKMKQMLIVVVVCVLHVKLNPVA